MAPTAVVWLAVAGAFYPDGHFERVTRITADNVEDTIRAAVDGDKTLFVRFIASER